MTEDRQKDHRKIEWKTRHKKRRRSLFMSRKRETYTADAAAAPTSIASRRPCIHCVVILRGVMRTRENMRIFESSQCSNEAKSGGVRDKRERSETRGRRKKERRGGKSEERDAKEERPSYNVQRDMHG